MGLNDEAEKQRFAQDVLAYPERYSGEAYNAAIEYLEAGSQDGDDG